ncbi:MAG: hypothetical protein JXA01_03350 [Dehalococcoidia bacterium]|nr:hypothetical protein [Dehalococcoidia bacterium]
MKRIMLAGTLFSLLILSLLSGCVYVGVPQIATFQSSPEAITAGETATLIWAVVGAESVSIAPNLGTLPLAGSRQVSPNQTTAYTLTARNSIGAVNSAVTVTVKAAVNIINFEASPSRISAGSSSTLQWNVAGVSSVNISPDIGTAAPLGTYVVSPAKTQMYTLTAISGTQVLSKSVTVEVTSPPVVVQFNALPKSIELGHASTLTWNVSGANKVTIEPELGTVPAAGSSFVFPNKTTVYTLTAASDCCVVDRTVIVQVAQFPAPFYLPIVELFNISPNSIYKGNSAILEWSVSNADSIFINNGIGPVAASGSIAVSPSNSSIYTITASNIYGSRYVSIGIAVFSP